MEYGVTEPVTFLTHTLFYTGDLGRDDDEELGASFFFFHLIETTETTEVNKLIENSDRVRAPLQVCNSVLHSR